MNLKGLISFITALASAIQQQNNTEAHFLNFRNPLVQVDSPFYQRSLEMGFDLNSRITQYDGLTLAVSIGDIESVKMFLATGSDLNRADLNPLVEAVLQNHAEMVWFLLRTGADFNLQENLSKMSAYDLAHENNPYMVGLFREYERNLDEFIDGLVLKNLEFRTAYYAILSNLVDDNVEAVKENLEKVMRIGKFGVNTPIFKGCPVLLQAAKTLSNAELPIKSIKMFLEMGANPNVTFNNRFDALILASMKDNFKVVKLLLEFGAKVNRPTMEFNSMCAALRSDNPEIVDLLLRHGANIYLIEPYSGDSVLEKAREYDNLASMLVFDHDEANKKIFGNTEKIGIKRLKQNKNI